MYFVRTAHERDLDAIRNLLLAAYHVTYDALYGVDKVNELNADWNAADQLKTLIKDPGGEFLVADNGRSIGGVAYACMSTRTPHTAALVKLYVHPDWPQAGHRARSPGGNGNLLSRCQADAAAGRSRQFTRHRLL